MTDAEGAKPSTEGAEPVKPAAKRARKRSTPKPTAEAAPAPAQEAPKPSAKPPAEAPQPLNELIMAQTAESLAALSANLTQAMTRANTAISTAFVDQTKDAANWQPDPLGMQAALNDVWSHLAAQPETLREAHASLWQRYAGIWQKHATYMLTGQQAEEGPVRDKRFKDPEWRSNPAFSMLRESYLATAEFITDLVNRTEGVDEATKRKAVFYIKQAVDAASPSNFLMTNPAALRALFQSGGESLVKGV
jgi:polyhydroxyalkanoate synthase